MCRLVVVFIVFSISFTSAQAQYWEQLPGPTGGPVRDFAALPDGTLLASQAEGLLFRSTDDGTSWEHIGTRGTKMYPWDNMWYPLYDGVQQFVVTPQGSIIGRFYNSPMGAELLRSTDRGSTWHWMYPGFDRITISPTALLSVSADGVIVLVENKTASSQIQHVYVSDDDGNSWKMLEGITDPVVALRRNSLFRGNASGLFHSTDLGASWDALSYTYPYEIVSTSFLTLEDSLLFCCLEGGTHNTILTTDDGATWHLCIGLESKLKDLHRLHDGRLLGRSSGQLLISDDNGYNWNKLSSLDFAVSYASEVSSDGSIFLDIADSQPVLRSTDLGISWHPVDRGMHRPSIMAISCHEQGMVFAGSAAGGLNRSTDNGQTWTVDSTALLPPVIRIQETTWGNLYGYSYSNCMKSTDYGISWKPLDNNWTSVLELGKRFYAAEWYGAIVVSDDSGSTWTLQGKLPRKPGANDGMDDVVLRAVISGTDTTFIAATDQGMRRSTDLGKNWDLVPLDGKYPLITAVHVADDTSAYICTYDHVWRSEDAGLSWKSVFHSPDSGLATTITANSRGDIFISEWDIIMRSRDRGATWTAMPNLPLQLLRSDVRSLAADPEGHLFVGTISSGIFRSEESTLEVSPSAVYPQSLSITSIWPQPLRKGVDLHLCWENTRSGPLRLLVSDLLGRVVLEKDIPKMKARGEFQLQTGNLRSGIYYLRLVSDESAVVRSVIIQ